jgi:hypothetical protein
VEFGSGSLAGRLVDSTGRPVPGMPALAHMNESQGNPAWGVFHWLTTSAEHGRFDFEELPRSRYDVEFGDLPQARWELENHWSCELDTAASRSDARLVLAECTTVEGWVELGERDPARLRVVARGPGDVHLASESTVAADARFRLTPCRPSSWKSCCWTKERKWRACPWGREEPRG